MGKWLVSMLMVLGCVRCVCAQPGTIGAEAGRVGVTAGPVAALSGGPAWVFPASDPTVTQELGWISASTVSVDAQRMYAMSVQRGAEPSRLIAIDRVDGRLAWWAELPDAVFDSWSSPTLDRMNSTVLIGTGQPGALGGVVRAFDASTGSQVWEAALSRDEVNASVVVTDDLGPADRAFIVDYEGFYQGGTGAAVTCINVDAFDAASNPHQPGEVVWSVDLFDGASGATPAYAEGRLFVGTTGDTFAGTGGRVVCLDAEAATGSSAVVWDTALGGDDGFFGPMSVHGDGVYGVTYDFFGGDRSSRLVKLGALTGAIEWVAASDRSSVAPVALGDGRVLVSAGILGFGSVPRLTMYADHGSSGVEVWDTVLSTWVDDGNGQIEPGEYLVAGGWSSQPVVRVERGRTLAVVGRDGGGGGSGGLVVLDVGLMPDEAGFVVDSFASVAGPGSPAAGFITIYTVSDDGISAFGAAMWADVNGDGLGDGDDLRAWHRGIGSLDVNLDGVVDSDDLAALERFVRRNEWWEMIAGRRP